MLHANIIQKNIIILWLIKYSDHKRRLGMWQCVKSKPVLIGLQLSINIQWCWWSNMEYSSQAHMLEQLVSSLELCLEKIMEYLVDSFAEGSMSLGSSMEVLKPGPTLCSVCLSVCLSASYMRVTYNLYMTIKSTSCCCCTHPLPCWNVSNPLQL